MGLLAAWGLYPLVLVAICLGLGLLVARAAAWDLPRVLLPGVGLAALLAVSRLVTATAATAPLALPVVLVLAVAGLVLGRDRLRARPDWLVVVGFLAVFAVYAGPVVMSGAPTFAGYTSLPDTSHQLALAEHYPENGPDWESVPDGSFKLALAKYIDTAYPVAGQTALGVTAPLGVLDVAWLYQPFLALVAATLFGAMLALIAPWVRSRWLRVGIAFVAAQPALVYSFSLQGSIKELCATAMIALGTALVVAARHQGRPARSLLPVAIVAAAALGALGPASGPYLAVLALIIAVLWLPRLRRAGGRIEAAWLAVGAAVAGVLAIPMIVAFRTAYTVNTGTLNAAEDLGNLARPLKLVQAFGVWPTGDFRFDPGSHRRIAYAFVALAVLAAVLGLVWAIRRRAYGPLALLAVLGGPALYLLHLGSPYADAKVLVLLSPALVLLASVGVLALGDRGILRFAAAGLGALLALGVVGSNALSYRDVSLAPHDRYAELLEINEALDDKGPAVSTEYDEFGAYFLRDAQGRSQPEWPHEYRDAPYDPNALFDPDRRPSIKTPLDLDDLKTEYVQSVPYVVVRRSPNASRPPANFVLERRGRWYDVWRRTDDRRVLEHLPLGLDVFSASQVPSCRAVRGVARTARDAGGRLAYVARPAVPTLALSALELPASWYAYGAFPASVVPRGAGRVTGALTAREAGTYRIWLQGSFGREMRILVDGKQVGTVADQLNNPGNWEQIAALGLTAGQHRIDVLQGGGTLAPGSGGFFASLRFAGPLVLSGEDNEQAQVQTLPADDWRALCGRRLDWVEAVR